MTALKSVSRHLRRLARDSLSGRGGHVVTAGERLTFAALSLSRIPPTHLLSACPRLLEGLRRRLPPPPRGPCRVEPELLHVTQPVLASMSDCSSPPPCLGVFPKPCPSKADSGLPAPGYSVLAWGVSDPGNVGGLARAAWCLGASRLLTGRGTASPWSQKALRSGTGAQFDLPVLTPADDAEALAAAAAGAGVGGGGGGGGRFLVAWATRTPDCLCLDSPEAMAQLADLLHLHRCCLVLGSESSGLSDSQVAKFADTMPVVKVHVPMAPVAGEHAPALNVAQAGAVILHRMLSVSERASNPMSRAKAFS